MRQNAKDMDAINKDMAENTQTMNAVDHMKFHSQITEVHLDQVKKFIPPFETLYASMSDGQKKITDTTFRTERHGKHRRK
jgi:23S rRNA U2552 (ribose-2'-O)-methylase RlmE/FtsJ